MEDKAELVEDIVRVVQDTSYDAALILRFINRARKRIAGRVFLPALRSEGAIATYPGESKTPMPDDFHRELFHCYNDTQPCRLSIYKSKNQMLRDYPDSKGLAGGLVAVVVEQATPQAAIGTITLAGLPVIDETFIVDTQTFTFKALRANPGEVTIGIDETATAANIVTALETDLSDVSMLVGVDSLTVTSVEQTAAANDILFSTAATNMTMDGSGFLGGTQLGVKTAWLHHLRAPTEANSLTIHYFALPADLSADTDIPAELPEDLAYDLIYNETVYRVFKEIYSEDKSGIVGTWRALSKEKIDELNLLIGPYERESVQIRDAAGWDEL